MRIGQSQSGLSVSIRQDSRLKMLFCNMCFVSKCRSFKPKVIMLHNVIKQSKCTSLINTQSYQISSWSASLERSASTEGTVCAGTINTVLNELLLSNWPVSVSLIPLRHYTYAYIHIYIIVSIATEQQLIHKDVYTEVRRKQIKKHV